MNQGISVTVTKTLQVCRVCFLKFQPVDWLAHRLLGYCSKKCEKFHEESMKDAKP